MAGDDQRALVGLEGVASCSTLARSRLFVGSSSISSCGARLGQQQRRQGARGTVRHRTACLTGWSAARPRNRNRASRARRLLVVRARARTAARFSTTDNSSSQQVEPLRQQPQRHHGAVPPAGASSPAMVCSNVVLPAPFGPDQRDPLRPAHLEVDQRAPVRSTRSVHPQHDPPPAVRRCTAGRRGCRRRRGPRLRLGRAFLGARRLEPLDVHDAVLARRHLRGPFEAPPTTVFGIPPASCCRRPWLRRRSIFIRASIRSRFCFVHRPRRRAPSARPPPARPRAPPRTPSGCRRTR